MSPNETSVLRIILGAPRVKTVRARVVFVDCLFLVVTVNKNPDRQT